MDRRSSIGKLFGKSSDTKQTELTAPPPQAGLDPYTGPWTELQAGHLMKRCTFGPDQSLIEQAIGLGVDAAVDALFDNAKVFDPPVKYTYDESNEEFDNVPVVNEPVVSYGETWVNEPPIVDYGDQELNQRVLNSRFQSVYAWTYKNIYEEGFSIMSKLWMFWHNHFVVADFRLPLEQYQYANVLLSHATGNFKQLTKDITINPSMLRYLNGNENNRIAPNENYARELLELFTVGKGELAGPGDYTTFTEDDVIQIARVLTGWIIDIFSIDTVLQSRFILARHDIGQKQLSHRFNNEVISNGGEEEYSNLIDTIFNQDAVSENICRKLYRYFLNYEITDTIEEEVIKPMASILRDNDYEIRPALSALLKSEHFYSSEAVGCMIKNPTDFIVSMTRGIGFEMPTDIAPSYFFSLVFNIFSAEMEMFTYNHPDVAGWKAYYQEPQYYRTWINTYLLPRRNQSASSFVSGGPVAFNGGTAQVPPLIPVFDYIANFEDPYDPNVLIDSIANQIFSYPITTSQRDYLKEILIPGLPDYEWTVEYSEYLANPDNIQLQNAVGNRLQDLLVAMVEMPEFQLM